MSWLHSHVIPIDWRQPRECKPLTIWAVYRREQSLFPTPQHHRSPGKGENIFSALGKSCFVLKLSWPKPVWHCSAEIMAGMRLGPRGFYKQYCMCLIVFYYKVKYRFWCLSMFDPDYIKSPFTYLIICIWPENKFKIFLSLHFYSIPVI